MEKLDKVLTPVLTNLMTLPPGNDNHHDVIWLYSWLIQHERSVEDFIYVLGPLQARLIQGLATQTTPMFERNVYEGDDTDGDDNDGNDNDGNDNDGDDTDGDDNEGDYNDGDDNDGDDTDGDDTDGDAGRNNSISDEGNDASERFHFWSSRGSRGSESPPHNSIYVARAASEALAMRCPVLEGQWETVIDQLLKIFDSYCSLIGTIAMYGPASTKFSNWLINVASDPYLCPNQVMRFKMLDLFKILFKFDDGNREQALDSLMLACSFLDRRGELSLKQIWDNIIFNFELFTKDNYLSHIDIRIAEKFRKHRDTRERIQLHDISHEYAIGLKTLSQPREVQILTVLLKSASEGSRIDYQILNEEYDDKRNTLLYNIINEASIRLFSVLGHFKRALQEPELISITSESTMDVLEALVVFTGLYHIPNPEFVNDRDRRNSFIRFQYICWSADLTIAYDLLKDFTDGRTIDKTPLKREIIRRYKGRICKMRSLFTEYVRNNLKRVAPMIYDIVYNDEY